MTAIVITVSIVTIATATTTTTNNIKIIKFSLLDQYFCHQLQFASISETVNGISRKEFYHKCIVK